jgi:reactive intermediate/imine deaminase
MAQEQSARKQAWSFPPETGVPLEVAPYAHATTFGSLVFCTGQMPIEPATGALVTGGILVQAEQVRQNLKAVLEQLDLSLDDALMVRVYLTDFEDFEAFNAAYRGWFRGSLPSRTCVGVSALALGAAIEIDLVAGIAEPGIS